MFSVLTSPSQAQAVRSQWDDLVRANPCMLTGISPIGYFDIILLAKTIFDPNSDLRVFYNADGHTEASILPCFSKRRGKGVFAWNHLTCALSIYPGRSGIIHTSGSDAVNAVEALLLEFFGHSKAWHVFSMAAVSGGPTEAALLNATGALSLSCHVTNQIDIPYITLPSSWETYLGGLAKKFRYTIRSGERQLRSIGRVEVRRYSATTECAEFLAHVFSIERRSWKERNRTSLTTQTNQKAFHEQLAPIAAGLGVLQGYVLSIDEKPIAYIYGLKTGNVFCDLKESYDEEFASFSPGAVLKASAMQDLIDQGVKHWDFVGPADFHKRRWTSQTYRLTQYCVYAGRMGRLIHMRQRIGRSLRRLNLLPKRPDDFGRPTHTRNTE